MNTTYRSVFSGQEIDEAIAAMKASSGLVISNDFSGGTTEAASAELAKILKERIDGIEDPVNLLALLNQIDNFNLFTDADKAILAGVNSNFKGVFTNVAARDAAIPPESINYTGNEVVLVLDNGTGAAEFDHWDTTIMGWVRIKLYGTGEFTPITVAVPGTVATMKFKTSLFNTMKCLVSASNADKSQRQVQEIMISLIGTDTYISVYGDVGNAHLFDATSGLDGNGNVVLYITTLVANVTVTGKQLAAI